MEKILLVLFALFLGVAGRWLPHPPNFTPVLAISIFVAMRVGHKGLAVGLPLLIMFLSDLILGFHETAMIVYASLGVLALGVVFLKSTSLLSTKSLQIIGYSLMGSVWFFLSSNAGVWWLTDLYEPSLSGLWASYLAAVPFFHNTLLSTLVFMAGFYVLEAGFVRFKLSQQIKN